METANPIRIVPSGKVYRQMFDAEVQLVRALSQRENSDPDDRANTPTVMLVRRKSGVVAESQSAMGIPIVRDAATGPGMLTVRQRMWLESFPNESHVENPVLFKYHMDELKHHLQETPGTTASREVRGLPDIVTPAKIGSDIIERIAESRRQRHDAALEDMYQELAAISNDLEPRVVEASSNLLSWLEKDTAEIDTLMASSEQDEDLVRYTYTELASLWTEVSGHTVRRHDGISELDETLATIEDDRADMGLTVFQSYSEMLRKIAHLMPPQLQTMLDAESQAINQTMLSNRRSYADLYSKLMTADIEREKKLHTEWTNRVEKWRALHMDVKIDCFQKYIESDAVTVPPGAERIMQKLRAEQKTLNDDRLELIDSLRRLFPPTSTKTAVYQWNQQMTHITKKIDTLNQEYFNKLYAEYELVCQRCLEELEHLVNDLVETGVASETTARDTINKLCLPLVGERQASFEKLLENMDSELEVHNSQMLVEIRALFKFCQGAAHIWDVHELGLAKQERALHEGLDECRHQHDNENQELEAELDIVMDRMRQEATEKTLNESLTKALGMLNKIKDGYEAIHTFQADIVAEYPRMVHEELTRYDEAELIIAYEAFHTFQADIVAEYPRMVHEELTRYDEAVCLFFTVNRNLPPAEKQPSQISMKKTRSKGSKDKSSQEKVVTQPEPTKERSSVQEAIPEQKPTEQERETEKGIEGEDVGDGEKTREVTSKKKLDQKGSESFDVEPLPLAVSEVLSTTKGTTFYVMSVAADTYELPPQQIWEDRAEYITEIIIPQPLIADIKKTICLNFLNHLEEWTEQGNERSHSIIAAKTEELNSELDLRLHLHKPRSSRAELDIHHVRAAELIMHNERVSRHCKGIKLSLSELKRDFTNMNQSHNRLTETFKQDIESLQVIFINATKSSKLIALSNQLQVEKEKYMEVIRASLRVFRQKLDDTLQMLRESNARFIKSFKVFSDGGNFCPEEIDGYRKKLEQMAQKIDKSEGSVMSDLEGIESKRLDQATKIASEFEERFKHHMVDLLFMERIARWLTNTQVKIKAEVADSNSEARRCFNAITDLHQRIDACERPNPDKQQVTSSQLHKSLSEMFHLFYRRSICLNCIRSLPAADVAYSGGASVHGAPATVVTRFGLPSEGSIQSVSKPGKLATEDPSISIIKTILKTQKEKLQLGTEAEISPEQILVSLGPHANVLAPPPGGHLTSIAGAPLTTENRDKGTRSRGSHHSDTRSHRSSKSGRGSVSEMREKRGHSAGGTHESDGSSLSLSRSAFSLASLGSLQKKTENVDMTRRSSKIDKKYFVFGEQPEEGEDLHLMGRITGVLRETLDGLLTASELYYRQKRDRPVTRPQALEETFEHCAETVVHKLQSYLVQADEYHNKCLQELREQLEKFERQLALIPRLVVQDKLQELMEESKEACAQLDTDSNDRLNELEKSRLQHQDKLRPQLGHPQKVKDLEMLCDSEETRRAEYLELVEQFHKQKQVLVVEQARVFIDNLASTGENMLLNFDNFLTVDDVIKGRVSPTKYPTNELLRRKKAGEMLEDDEDMNRLPRGKKTWHGIPNTELVVPGETSSKVTLMSKSSSKSSQGSRKSKRKDQQLLTASVVTAKTTLGHSATVEARDDAYQKYKEFFERCLAEIEAERQRLMVAEQRWTDSWHTSVKKVKLLYEA